MTDHDIYKQAKERMDRAMREGTLVVLTASENRVINTVLENFLFIQEQWDRSETEARIPIKGLEEYYKKLRSNNEKRPDIL